LCQIFLFLQQSEKYLSIATSIPLNIKSFELKLNVIFKSLFFFGLKTNLVDKILQNVQIKQVTFVRELKSMYNSFCFACITIIYLKKSLT